MAAEYRRTKIVATIGPASSSHESVLALAEAGMDAARLNFSHGTHEVTRVSRPPVATMHVSVRPHDRLR